MDNLEMPVEDLLRVHALAQEIGALWLIPFAIYRLHTKTFSNEAERRGFLISPLATRLDLMRLAAVARAATMEFSITDIILSSRSCNRSKPVSCEFIISGILLHSHEQLIATPLTFWQLAPKGFTFGATAEHDTVHALVCEVLCSACSTAVLKGNYDSARRRFWDALARDLVLGFDQASSMLPVQRRDIGLSAADA